MRAPSFCTSARDGRKEREMRSACGTLDSLNMYGKLRGHKHSEGASVGKSSTSRELDMSVSELVSSASRVPFHFKASPKTGVFSKQGRPYGFAQNTREIGYFLLVPLKDRPKGGHELPQMFPLPIS